jgi:hypothetical protein
VCTVCEISLSGFVVWRRHESSEHFEDGGWLCSQCIGSSAALHSSKAALQDHNASVHSMKDYEVESDKHLVGKNWLQSYYCGFCVQIHKQNSMRTDAHDARHEHIASHFRDGKTISDWKHIRPPVILDRYFCTTPRPRSTRLY